MDRSEKTILTNMCMIFDDDGNVLVQDKKDEEWGGITFPGGHVENRESFTDAVIREIYEESGLIIEAPQICGIKQWQEEEDIRYVVLCYKTNRFKGQLKSSEEGDVYWMKLSHVREIPLARGMEHMLRVFLEDEVGEYYIYEDNGEWNHVLK